MSALETSSPAASARSTLALLPIAAVLLLSACSAPGSDEEVVQSWLDREWSTIAQQFPDAQRPAVEVEQYLAPEAWAPRIVSCLHDAGHLNVELTPNGGFQANGAIDEAFELARYTCFAANPVDPVFLRDLPTG